jgi:hypothetical protein
MPRMLVPTSVARLISDVVIAPAVARRMPLNEPMESEPKNPWVEEAYVAERLVVEALEIIWSPVKVLLVYVFTIVVDALA